MNDFKEECFRLRAMIEELKDHAKAVKSDTANGVFDMSGCADSHEVLANLQLAYRHLEDARMRVGKAVQAYDGKDCLER